MEKLNRFRRELQDQNGKPFAYQLDGRGALILPMINGILRGDISDLEICRVMGGPESLEAAEEMAAALASPLIVPGGKAGKATGVVSVRGIALYDLEFQPFAFSTLQLARNVRGLANDPEVGTIVLDIDSPGGVVTGVPEAADTIFKAAQGDTNVVSLINPLAASAAYWLASQANEIVAVPSGDAGSIGVFMLHVDQSQFLEDFGLKLTFISAGKFKTEGNPFEPLSEEGAEFFQGEVNDIYQEFLRAVGRGRGVDVRIVTRDFGQSRTFSAKAAKAAGMIDRIATIDQTMGRLGVNQPTLDARKRRIEGNGGPGPYPNALQPDDRSEMQIENDAEPIELMIKDGKTFVTKMWPDHCVITIDALALQDGFIDHDDESVLIKVENGEALYTKKFEREGNVYCSLVRHGWTPPSSEEADTNLRRRRQLALLR